MVGSGKLSTRSLNLGVRKRQHGPHSTPPEDGEMLQQPHETARPSFLTPVVACILLMETAAKFSYFGCRAVLALYFTSSLHYKESTAIALYAYVTSLAYFSPVLGALLADGRLGRYRTILWFGVIYAIGFIILAAAAYFSHSIAWKRCLSFVGLLLVCIGTGGIKPCVTAFGADQVASKEDATAEYSQTVDELESSKPPVEEPHCSMESKNANDTVPQTDQMRAFFAWFYSWGQLGVVTSILSVPILKARFDFGAAFLTLATFLLLALAAFNSKRKEYVHHVPGEGSSSLANTFRLCGWLLLQRFQSNYPALTRCRPWGGHRHVLLNSEDDVGHELTASTTTSIRSDIVLRPKDSDFPSTEGNSDAGDGQRETSNGKHGIFGETTLQQLTDAAQALHVLPILALLPIFWMLYDQQGSVWRLQATRMNLHGLQPEQIIALNPIEIMIFIPLFDRYIYPALDAWGWNTSHLRRMGWGMLFCAFSFFVSGILESIIQSREEQQDVDKVSVLWQLPQISILAVAEICLCVTGLEFAYSSSPESMKTFLMAVYLLTTAIGVLFGGILYSSIFQSLNRATTMHACAALMLGNLALFCWIARWWEHCDADKAGTEKEGKHTQSEEPLASYLRDAEANEDLKHRQPLHDVEMTTVGQELFTLPE